MYKITAKRTTSQPPTIDQHGVVLWDGKPKLITCSVGEQQIIEYMFENMTRYTSKKEWVLKKVKI